MRGLMTTKRALVLPLTMLLGGCAIQGAVETLRDHSPPPEFGRPYAVRLCAGVGGWIGAAVGGVVSIVALPITWPLSKLAGDGLGEHTSDEFLLFPATTLAAAGHCLLGTPADILDWTFHRAWVKAPDPVTSYEFVPMEGPMVPQAPPKKTP